MPRIKRRWTVADRDQLPDDGNRYEVVDGELLVTPAPAWLHQDAVFRLHQLIAAYLERERVGHAFQAPADVVFAPDRAVQPDLFVTPLVNGRPPKAFGEAKRLLLAVEVISPASARSDRVDKRMVYRDAGVPEYWVVDLDARTIERTTPDEPRPEVLVDRLEWLPQGAATVLVIDVPSYFRSVLGD